MTLMTKDELLAPIDRKTKTIDLGGKKVRLMEMPFSEVGKLSVWLFPDGEMSKERRANYRLRQAVMSIVDESGKLVFDFPDTKEGNKAFAEFAETIGKGGAGHWSKIIEEVNDLYGEETDDLEKK